MAGRASLKLCQNSSSSRRFSSLSSLKEMITARSRRSPLVANSAMPFRMMGRVASMMVSSRSVYSWRVLKPPPVARRHNASESQSGRWLRLSRAMIHEPLASTNRSRSSFGAARKPALLGSVKARTTLLPVLLQFPCSPFQIKIGYGPCGRNAANSHEITRFQSSSSLMLRNWRKSSI